MTPTERKEMPPVCCYCDNDLSCSCCGVEQPYDDISQAKARIKELEIRLAAEPAAGVPTRFEIVTALKAANKNFMATGSDRESDERYDDMADSMSNLFRVSKYRSGE